VVVAARAAPGGARRRGVVVAVDDVRHRVRAWGGRGRCFACDCRAFGVSNTGLRCVLGGAFALIRVDSAIFVSVFLWRRFFLWARASRIRRVEYGVEVRIEGDRDRAIFVSVCICSLTLTSAVDRAPSSARRAPQRDARCST
jgi:hypothetical protein